MFSEYNEVISKINAAGRAKTPFLFGVDFELSEGFFVENPLRQNDILFNINGVGNCTEAIPNNPFRFDFFPEEESVYSRRFATVMDGLRHGNSFLTNLTIITPIETDLSLKDIFLRSRAMCRLFVPERFVCFSPERFVRIENGRIYAHPMKGTIDATIENAAEIILNDYKEKAEHNTIADLIRNDINRIATRVKVNRFRYIDRLETNKGAILQVSSEIEGTLPDNWQSNLGALLSEMLPAGSISGAPKQATLDIIRRAEQEPRGYYTGVVGYSDGEVFDSYVLIRYIEKQGNRLFFRSGGGITINSVCESEYNEVIQKFYVPFH